MLVISRNIHIQTPVERVFALMTDPAARSALAPHASPIRVEIEGGGLLQAGSICHFRLQADNRVLDYRTHVREFLPNQRIVMISDTAVPFEIVLETRPQDGGTRLTHTERFEPEEEMLRLALQPAPADAVMEIICRWLPFLDPEYAVRVRHGREEMLAQKLGENLEQWLDAIKRRLEDTRPA
jgi:uncharacterized protein YndB with AHSA1/START domain